jgi:hypothetical protein
MQISLGIQGQHTGSISCLWREWRRRRCRRGSCPPRSRDVATLAEGDSGPRGVRGLGDGEFAAAAAPDVSPGSDPKADTPAANGTEVLLGFAADSKVDALAGYCKLKGALVPKFCKFSSCTHEA